ncbi:MAG: hypothetical protein GY803_06975 [Chloroflexi bacterium]|nr:hypothetical protein [Chloroflexota bacterium]
MFNTQTPHRFEKIVNAASLVLFVIGLAAAAVLALSNTPPALQINLLQALLLEGEYNPFLTIMILVFPIVIVVVILKTICVFLFNQFWLKEGEPKIPYAYKLRWR